MPAADTVTIVLIGILIFTAHLFTEFFRRTSIPDILLLIAIGLVFGPLFGIIRPEDIGGFGRIFTTITLIVILFRGGLRMRLAVLRRFLSPGLRLAVGGFFLTLAIVAIAYPLLTGSSFSSAILLGSIVGGTGSAIVIPIASQLRLTDASRTIISIEAAVSDALIVLFTAAVVEAWKLGEVRLLHSGFIIFDSILFALAAGVIGAFVWSAALSRIRRLQNPIFVTMAFLFIIYGIVDVLGFSGALSAIAFGVVLGNMDYLKNTRIGRYVHFPLTALNVTERTLFAEVEYVLKSLFFVYVGILMRLNDLLILMAGAALTLAIFAVRLPLVRASLPKSLPASDAAIISSVGTKGLVTAYAAFIPVLEGIPGSSEIQAVSYAIILFSVILCSLLIFLINRTPAMGIYGLIFKGYGKKEEKKTAKRSAA